VQLLGEPGQIKKFFDHCILSKFDIQHMLCKKKDRRGFTL